MQNTDFVIPGIGSTAAVLSDDMKLCNGDVMLDDAVADIVSSAEEFTLPNVDLLVQAVNDTPWDE